MRPADEVVGQLDALLTPLADRQRRWLAGELDADWEDPALVRAQPLVVRVEKADPPTHTDTLTAAARAAIALLADLRSGPDGDWHADVHAWIAGRIRKVARRARGAHWRAATDLPGVTVAYGTAEVRAFVPYLVSELPKELSRLQVAGIELVDPPDADPGPVAPGPALWLTPAAQMSTGKAMAQVGHATMLLAAYAPKDRLAAWAEAGFPVTVRRPARPEWTELLHRPDIVPVRDAGFTEVEPGTITVIATP